MRKLNYSLRELYRTLEQPGDNPLRDAHARLHAAVRAAYRMPSDADPLALLLEFNLACAAKEKPAEKITPPGLPLPPEDHAAFITDDCIRPPSLISGLWRLGNAANRDAARWGTYRCQTATLFSAILRSSYD